MLSLSKHDSGYGLESCFDRLSMTSQNLLTPTKNQNTLLPSSRLFQLTSKQHEKQRSHSRKRNPK